MRLTWIGHACFAITSDTASLLVDPWIKDNPVAAPLPRDFAPGALLVTHGHSDHLGDALELSARFGAPIIAVPELARYCDDLGAATVRVHYGGSIDVDGARIKCVPAMHSSSAGPQRTYAGNPCGFLIRIGTTSIYHAGDTCLFGDMRLIGDERSLSVALLPIGGRFTMDPTDAVRAVKLLRPRVVIPMHFNTLPEIRQDVSAFQAAIHAETDARCEVLEPGGSYDAA